MAPFYSGNFSKVRLSHS